MQQPWHAVAASVVASASAALERLAAAAGEPGCAAGEDEVELPEAASSAVVAASPGYTPEKQRRLAFVPQLRSQLIIISLTVFATAQSERCTMGNLQNGKLFYLMRGSAPPKAEGGCIPSPLASLQT